MANFKKCNYCGDSLDYSMRYDASFCSENCRTKFHNALRKNERAYMRAWLAIKDICEIAEVSPKLGDAALLRLDHLHELLTAYLNGGYWYCHNCGQTRFVKPDVLEECSFCGRSDWKLAVKTG